MSVPPRTSIRAGAMLGGTAGEEIDPAVLAAIVAAVEKTWPQPVAASSAGQADPSRWRFSARWWSREAASRPSRPW